MGISIKTSLVKRFRIINLYCPPISSVEGESRTSGFDPALLPTTKDTLICGDLNCASTMWDGNQPPDQMGERLLEWLLDSGMGVLNDGTGTRINRATGQHSATGVSLMRNAHLVYADWSNGPCFGSDHLPVLVRVELAVECIVSSMTKLEGCLPGSFPGGG